MHFSLVLPKRANGRYSLCSMKAEIGSLSESDGNAAQAAGGDDSIDHDEYLAGLISRLLNALNHLVQIKNSISSFK